MNQQEENAVNELLKAAIEHREASAIFTLIMIKNVNVNTAAVIDEAKKAGVKDGFDARLQESIAHMEALLNNEDRAI